LSPKDEAKFPVVILSPGFGGSYLMNMSLAEELSSHGYYVLNVGHTFFNSTPTFPDGKKIELLSMDTLIMDSDDFMDPRFKWRLNTYIKIQKDDIVSVLNNLSSLLDESQQKVIDTENVTCIGYSAGGATAAEICVEDKRIKAGININGVLYGDAWKDSIGCPFLYINADYSSPKKAEIDMLGGQRVIDSLMQFYDYRKLLFSQNSTSDFYELTLASTTHHNFSDYALISQEYCGRTNPKKCLQLTYRYVLLFLNKFQKSQSSAELDNDVIDKKHRFTVLKTR
jgi:dienelactone hydrolase